MIPNRRETNLIEDFAELGIDAIKKQSSPKNNGSPFQSSDFEKNIEETQDGGADRSKLEMQHQELEELMDCLDQIQADLEKDKSPERTPDMTVVEV